MKRRVAIVEFCIHDQFPLASGYLISYAKADPAVNEAFDFVFYQQEVARVDYEETLKALRRLNANVLCFSCYVWNMGLVRRLVRDMQHDPGIERIILGGHQISHQAHRYVEQTNEKTIVINGQGEIPFRATMQRLSDSGDLTGLQGVSFYKDGSLHNGGEAEMLSNLDDIPSPYLTGFFDRLKHPVSVFETNRGCPFKCTFCTWGGDTLKVSKFSLDRVKAELDWLARKSVLYLMLGDANWGMLPRDIELSEYIAGLKKKQGFPWIVYYAAAKNKPDASVACIEKFSAGGVITSQALGIQSMNPETLSLIDRKNIRNSSYIEMFERLQGRGIDSYCELIWPLPGETLDTLKAGFDRLLQLGAQTIIMYPSILINNARMTDQADEHGMETRDCGDWKSELQLVKKTRYADRAAVQEGFWMYYGAFLLANCDPTKAALRYLKKLTGKSYTTLLSEFSVSLRAAEPRSPYVTLLQDIFDEDAHGTILTIGRLGAHLTHAHRLGAQFAVARFIASQLPGEEARAALLALLWACSMPRMFSDTKDSAEELVRNLESIDGLGPALTRLAHVNTYRHTTTLDVLDAPSIWAEILPYFGAPGVAGPINSMDLSFSPDGKLPYHADPARNFTYAQGMIQRLGFLAARVKVLGGGDVRPMDVDATVSA